MNCYCCCLYYHMHYSAPNTFFLFYLQHCFCFIPFDILSDASIVILTPSTRRRHCPHIYNHHKCFLFLSTVLTDAQIITIIILLIAIFLVNVSFDVGVVRVAAKFAPRSTISNGSHKRQRNIIINILIYIDTCSTHIKIIFTWFDVEAAVSNIAANQVRAFCDCDGYVRFHCYYWLNWMRSLEWIQSFPNIEMEAKE